MSSKLIYTARVRFVSLAIVMLTAAFAVALSGVSLAADIKVIPTIAQVSAGETFHIDVVAENIPSAGLGAVQFRLNVSAAGSPVVSVSDASQAGVGDISVSSPLLIGPATATRSGLGDFFRSSSGPNGVLAMDNEPLTGGSGLYTYGHTNGAVLSSGSGSIARFVISVGKNAVAESINITLTDVMLLESGEQYALDSNTGATVDLRCMTTVPNILGMSPGDAGLVLGNSRLLVGNTTELGNWNGAYALNKVLTQSASAGTALLCNTPVDFAINIPPSEVGSPSVSPKYGDESGAVILSWIPSSSADKAGYRIYLITETAHLLMDLSSGAAAGAEIPGLPYGRTSQLKISSYDTSGNESTGLLVSAVPGDDVPPTGSIAISGGAYAKTASVTLLLSASDGGSGLSKMCISNGATCSTWEDFAGTKQWELSPGDEKKTVYARYQDKAGNITPTPYSAEVTLDTTPPDLAVSTLSDGSWTRSEVLNVAGRVTDNYGMQQFTINGTDTTANPDGTYSYAVVMQDGANTVTVIATDLAGNITTDTRTVNFDRTAPILAVTSPADNIKTKQTPVELAGSVDEQSTVTVKINGADALPVQMDGNNFSLSIPPVYGINTIEVTAADRAGNTSSVKRTLTFDDRNPSLAVTIPAQDIKTNQGNLIIKGETSDITTVAVTVTIDSNTYAPLVTDGKFELPVIFTEEKIYQIYVKAVNEVGSETLVQRNVVYDVTAPIVTIDAVITPTKQMIQLLTGTVEAASTVSVSCPTAVVGGVSYPTITTWSAEISDMQEGDNTITVSAVDEAGNVSANSVSAVIAVDTTPPDSLIIATPQDPSNNTSAIISFAATEAGSTFECQLDSSGYTSCSSPVSYSGLSTGGHTFSVRAMDAVGNTDQTPASYTWMIDTQPPSSTILSPVSGATMTVATLVITGTASDIGSRVQKVEVSTDGGSTWLAASGTSSWSYSWLVPMDGFYTIKSRATDIAGNVEAPVSGTSITGYRRQPASVLVNGRQLLVNGSPFQIKGVVYSPVPIGADTTSAVPYGDYFTSGYSDIYNRDLPILRQMGANTVRLNIWDDRADHHDFLDRAYNGGVNPIYVIAGYWINAGMDIDPSSSGNVRAQLKADFRAMVANHKNHPAILMWAIGNDLNAGSIYGSNPHLFSLINEMSDVAHTEEGAGYHPVTTSLSDENLISTIAAYDAAVPALDIWSANVYRSNTFGSLFGDYALASSKPFAVLEYGIDAFDNVNNDEYENIGSPYQSTYTASFWNEISSNSNVCIGGTIMEYSDEWWKGRYAIDPSCSDSSPALHGICGQAVNFTPDGYDNQEWWGLMRPRVSSTGPDVMEPRALYYTLQELWAGLNNAPHITVAPNSANFGIVAVGSNSSAQTLTVSNTGADNLYISTITVAGPNASEFSKQKDYCSNRTLVPGKSCTLQVVFAPVSAGSKSASVTISSDDPATSAVTIGLVATSTASVSGTVTSGGIPLLGVTMTLTGSASATTTTDASGNYTFTGLPSGSFTITPAMSGYVFTPANSSVTVSNGNVAGRNFTADPVYSIKGEVASGGSPLSGVTVALSGVSSATTITDSSGSYEFAGLTSGSYIVAPSKTGYTFAPAGISLDLNADAVAQNFTGTLITFTITPSAGSGGTISPSALQTVSYNSSVSFMVAPNAGYKISDVTVDGVSRGAITSFAFTNVTENHTISASFANIDTSINFGVFGATGVKMTGAGYVDSYDSSRGAYNGTHGTNGSIGTNSTATGAINLSGSAKVYGNAWVGPGGNPTKAIKTSGAATVKGTKGALTVAKGMTPMTDPGGGTAASFIGGTTLTSGTYRISAVNLSGAGVGTISGNVILYVTGSMNISGAAKILILPGGSLTVYISGSMNVSGGGIVNQTLNPRALTIYGTATCTSANYSGSSALYGAIYAPKAITTVSGSSDIYGAIVGGSVSITGAGAVHFDESLGNIGH